MRPKNAVSNSKAKLTCTEKKNINQWEVHGRDPTSEKFTSENTEDN